MFQALESGPLLPSFGLPLACVRYSSSVSSTSRGATLQQHQSIDFFFKSSCSNQPTITWSSVRDVHMLFLIAYSRKRDKIYQMCTSLALEFFVHLGARLLHGLNLDPIRYQIIFWNVCFRKSMWFTFCSFYMVSSVMPMASRNAMINLPSRFYHLFFKCSIPIAEVL